MSDIKSRDHQGNRIYGRCYICGITRSVEGLDPEVSDLRKAHGRKKFVKGHPNETPLMGVCKDVETCDKVLTLTSEPRLEVTISVLDDLLKANASPREDKSSAQKIAEGLKKLQEANSNEY